ncbi:hypothetical protein J6590_066137 [Homalodisca vitripennis]|nr:hypothetical protein J6590_066137 [Homalodisca vitripennis]
MEGRQWCGSWSGAAGSRGKAEPPAPDEEDQRGTGRALQRKIDTPIRSRMSVTSRKTCDDMVPHMYHHVATQLRAVVACKERKVLLEIEMSDNESVPLALTGAADAARSFPVWRERVSSRAASDRDGPAFRNGARRSPRCAVRDSRAAARRGGSGAGWVKLPLRSPLTGGEPAPEIGPVTELRRNVSFCARTSSGTGSLCRITGGTQPELDLNFLQANQSLLEVNVTFDSLRTRTSSPLLT